MADEFKIGQTLKEDDFEEAAAAGQTLSPGQFQEITAGEPQAPEGTIAGALQRGIAGQATAFNPGDSPEFPREDINPFKTSTDKVLARGASSFGNTKGTVARLKKDMERQGFEDVKANKNGEIVIKKEGQWIAFDPNNLPGANGWTLTEAFADTIDLSEVIAPTIGSIAGFVAGGAAGVAGGPAAPATVPGGAIAGSTAGAVAGEYVNQSLGRFFGTYDASPEEAAADLAWEGVFNVLGFAFKPAVKAVAPGIKRSAKKVLESQLFTSVFEKPTIQNIIKGLADASKKVTEPVRVAGKKVLNSTGRIIADTLNIGTGVNKQAARNLLARPIESLKNLDQILSDPKLTGKPFEELKEEFVNRSVDTVRKRLRVARRELGTAFRQKQGELLSDPNIGKYSANVGQVGRKFMDGLEEMGIGKIKPITGIVDEAGSPVFGAPVFELLEEDQLIKALTSEVSNPLIVKRSVRNIKTLVNGMNNLAKVGKVSGKEGAEKVLKLRRAIDDILFESNIASPREALGKLTDARIALAKTFGDSSLELGTRYNKMNAVWRDNVPHVEAAERATRMFKKGTDENSILSFSKNLMLENPDVEKGFASRNTWRTINNIGGDKGKAAEQELLDIFTSSQFLDKFPHVRTVSEKTPRSLEFIAENFRFGSGIVGVGSPRLRARTISAIAKGAGTGTIAQDPITQSIPFIKAFRDTVAGMPLSQKDALIRSPEVLQNMVAGTMQAQSESRALEGDLLNEVNQKLQQQQQQELGGTGNQRGN